MLAELKSEKLKRFIKSLKRRLLAKNLSQILKNFQNDFLPTLQLDSETFNHKLEFLKIEKSDPSPVRKFLFHQNEFFYKVPSDAFNLNFPYQHLKRPCKMVKLLNKAGSCGVLNEHQLFVLLVF
jgi:hypothetical protein